jgi:dihydroflavonol-4-reductase
MKALVTGATGFIGSHIVRVLLQAGWDVRVLVRPASNGHRRAAVPSEAEVAHGDIRDASAVASAIHGCQVLFHAAAMYDLWTRDPSQFYDANVNGTRTVLEVAARAGIDRAVYTSSVSTVKQGRDEQGSLTPKAVHSHYKRSKIIAEQVALGYPDVVVVNPSTPVGHGDVRPTPTGKIVLDFLRGRLPAYVNTGLNLIDVEDVAAGHLLALDKGQAGRRYILGNENVTLQAMLLMLASEAGLRPPAIRLPFAIAYAAGALSEVLEGRLAHRIPSVPFEGVRMAKTPMYFDPSRAQRELGLPQSPIPSALKKAVDWFRGNGYC